jgi:hypothetical protein
MGIPEIEAKRYEGKVKDGNILISVHAGTSERAATAKKLFEDAKASDISSATEATAPKSDKPEVRTTLRGDPAVSVRPSI